MPSSPRSNSPPPPPPGPADVEAGPTSETTVAHTQLPLAPVDRPSQRRARSRRIDDRDFHRKAFSEGQRRTVRAFSEAMFSEWREEGGGTSATATVGEGAEPRRAPLV